MAGKNEFIAIDDKWRTPISEAFNDFWHWILSALITPMSPPPQFI